MENKTISKLQGMALVAAMVASMSSVGFAATQIDFDPSVGLNWGDAAPDTQNYWSNTSGSPLQVNIDGTLTVAPLVGTTVLPTVDGEGAVGQQFQTLVDGQTSIYTLTELGETSTAVTTNAGGATIEKNGDVTLQGGSETSVTTTFDYANLVVIDSDPLSPTYGEVLSTSYDVVGVYDPATGTFTPNSSGLVGEAVTTTTPGGNLTMDGTLTVGAGQPGEAQLYVEDGVFELESGGEGLQIDTNVGVTSLSGGTESTTLTLADAGATLDNTLDMGGNTITGLAAGVAPTDAANVGQVATVQANLDAEAATRLANDNTLQGNINTEAATRLANDNAEAATRLANDNILQGNIDGVATDLATEVSTREGLISQDEAGRIHIGSDSLIIDQTVAGEARISADYNDGEGLVPATIIIDKSSPLVVEGTSNFGDTLTVGPLQDIGAVTQITVDATTLPGIVNDETTSTVFTQTGGIGVVTSSSTGGGVTIQTNGDVTLAKAVVGGTEVNYLQVTRFDVVNATGFPVPGSEVRVGGYLNEAGAFVELGPLTTVDGVEVLDLAALTEGQLAAITTVLAPDTAGANLVVEGNATIDGLTTTHGINNSGATITGVAAGVAATDAANVGQVTAAVASEAGIRAAADTTLQANITAEAGTRAAADTTLQANITAEAGTRAAADTTLQANITAEAGTRAAADTALQGRATSLEGRATALEAATSELEGDVSSLQTRINNTDDRLDEVGAMASAFSALVPNDRAGGNTQISVGMGNYSGQNALAAGVFHYVNSNVLLNAGISASLNSGQTGARAGVTIGF